MRNDCKETHLYLRLCKLAEEAGQIAVYDHHRHDFYNILVFMLLCTVLWYLDLSLMGATIGWCGVRILYHSIEMRKSKKLSNKLDIDVRSFDDSVRS